MFKRIIRIWLFAICSILLSCSRQHYYKLSEFKLNGNSKNNLIQNRKPLYGDGNRDGCIVMTELSLDLTIKGNVLKGKVTDTETQNNIIFAMVNIDFVNGDVLNLRTDENGEFNIELFESIHSIKIQYIGFRDLNILL